MTSIKRILVPTDFSEPADEALNYAFDLAQTMGATVSLAHVFEDPFQPAFYSEQYVPMPTDFRDDILAHIYRQLAERVARSGRSDTSSEVLTGPTAPAIVDLARKQKADLIVMGTHGRHGVAHLLIGSVAERVVRTATCPVLTVRSTAIGRQTKAA
jgi:nucleotide-binding universal stress UspA family protein